MSEKKWAAGTNLAATKEKTDTETTRTKDHARPPETEGKNAGEGGAGPKVSCRTMDPV